MRRSEADRTIALLLGIDVLPLTEKIARKAGELVAEQRGCGRTYALADMMIAATAIQYNCPVWTDNRRDFDLPEVNLFPVR